MKIWYRVTITFTMLLVIFALLITGFQLAVYGDSHYGFYKKEYEKYRVTDDLNMKIDNVMAVTEHMMAYLIGKEEKLSIVTDVDACPGISLTALTSAPAEYANVVYVCLAM